MNGEKSVDSLHSSEGLQVTETYYRKANKSVIFLFYCAAVWVSRLPAVWIPLINSNTIYCRCA